MYGEPVSLNGASTALVARQDGWTFFCMERDRGDEPTRLLWVEARGGQICLIDGNRRVRFSLAGTRRGPTGAPEWLFVEGIQPDEPGPDASFSGGRRRDYIGTARTGGPAPQSVSFTVTPMQLLRAAVAGQESVEVGP
jgi:hypothetical protein